MKDYYKILGVATNATEDQMRQTYRQKAKLLHPDLNNNDPKAAAKLVEINEAYDILSNKEKRERYLAEVQAAKQQRMGAQQGAGQQRGPQYGPQYGQPPPPHGQQFAGGPGRQQTVIEQMTQNAYNQGYQKGFSDSSAKQTQREKLFNDQIAMIKDQLAKQTDKLFKTELDRTDLLKKIKRLEDEVGEVKAENETLWFQISDTASSGAKKADPAQDSKLKSIQKELTDAKARIRELTEEAADANSRRKAGEVAAYEKEMEITRLTEENRTLQDRVTSLEQYVDASERAEDYDSLLRERDDKLKQVKKMIKNTYYGTLGVVYWAENQEIFTAYDKLKKRYQAKYEKGDFKAKQKLDELENAYNALTHPMARKSYNATIDITEEDIAAERNEQKEFEAAAEQFLKEKAEDDFWAHVEELMFLAQTGDAESQNTLGEMYYYGDEIDKDLDQAFYWFKEAAKQQHTDALFNLGKCHLNGEGTPHDEAKGMGFIKQAAKMGNKEAAALVKP
ncbi:MAG: DnaJ domain-containing protein [Firmicutes bacterium]|nr:DnaJ domain-containing protein [Bacillota bacterium]